MALLPHMGGEVLGLTFYHALSRNINWIATTLPCINGDTKVCALKWFYGFITCSYYLGNLSVSSLPCLICAEKLLQYQAQ